MKGNSVSGRMPWIMLALGTAALAMRWGLYATAVDVKGLLLRNQPLGIALTVLTLGVLARIVLAVRKLETASACDDGPAASLPSAAGHVAAGAGILVTVLTAAPMTEGYLETAWRFLGLAAAGCLLLAGFARGIDRRPYFLLYVVVCLFFVLHIVTNYRLWSGNPQMQDYVFSLLGAMALMFFGYYAAAEDAGCGNPRLYWGMGLAAVYLCTAELVRSSGTVLYLGGILWVLTELNRVGSAAAQEEK